MRDSSTKYASLLIEWQAPSCPQYLRMNESLQPRDNNDNDNITRTRPGLLEDENGLGLLDDKCPSILNPAEVRDVMGEVT